MGQVLLQDKITTLSESSGTITLASGARLTIGGQQFVTSSAINVAADLSSAITRYQIFAVESSGVVSLVISTNENSVGPAGEVAWKLVGSYFSGDVGNFGSFVTIDGTPETLTFNYTPTGAWTTNVAYTGNMRVMGDKIETQVRVGADGGVPSPATNLNVNLPGSLSMDTNKLVEANNNLNILGGIVTSGAGFQSGRVVYISTTEVRATYWTVASNRVASWSSLTPASPFAWNASTAVFLEYTVPISGFSNTPIKDR